LPAFSSELSNPAALIQHRQEAFPDADFWGWFQLESSQLVCQKNFIRNLFSPVERVRARFESYFSKLTPDGCKIIAVHLRRGDYGYSSFFRAPCRWYEKWIRDEKLSPNAYVIYIASESAELYRTRFPGFRVVTRQDAGCPDSLAPYFDFFVLSVASVLGISNSSYSFLASMLNEHSERFVRPCSESNGLIPFDPWNAPVLLCREVSDAEHKKMTMVD
jgi:hypothetical protein